MHRNELVLENFLKSLETPTALQARGQCESRQVATFYYVRRYIYSRGDIQHAILYSFRASHVALDCGLG